MLRSYAKSFPRLSNKSLILISTLPSELHRHQRKRPAHAQHDLLVCSKPIGIPYRQRNPFALANSFGRDRYESRFLPSRIEVIADDTSSVAEGLVRQYVKPGDLLPTYSVLPSLAQVTITKGSDFEPWSVSLRPFAECIISATAPCASVLMSTS